MYSLSACNHSTCQMESCSRRPCICIAWLIRCIPGCSSATLGIKMISVYIYLLKTPMHHNICIFPAWFKLQWIENTALFSSCFITGSLDCLATWTSFSQSCPDISTFFSSKEILLSEKTRKIPKTHLLSFSISKMYCSLLTRSKKSKHLVVFHLFTNYPMQACLLAIWAP